MSDGPGSRRDLQKPAGPFRLESWWFSCGRAEENRRDAIFELRRRETYNIRDPTHRSVLCRDYDENLCESTDKRTGHRRVFPGGVLERMMTMLPSVLHQRPA